MSVYVALIAVLLSTIILSELFRRLNLPTVVGQILGGLILGIPVIKSTLFQGSSLDTVSFLANIGIIFLLLLVGLEIDIDKIEASSRDASLIALFASVTPFMFGFTFLRFLGYDTVASVIFGGALSVTAEGTTVKVLMDAGAVNTRLGALIVSAGTIDDIFEVLMLSLVTVVGLGGGFSKLIYLPVELIIFVGAAYFGYRTIRWIIGIIDGQGDVELFSVTVLFVLSLAALSNYLEIGALIGAIVAGFILQLTFRRLGSDREIILDRVKVLTIGFLVPFFFVNIGLTFNYGYLMENLFLIAAATVLAVSGKIIGTMATGFFSNIGWRKLYVIGWGMNSRGAVGLVIALIALQKGLIPEKVYAALVVMAMITTLVFPLVLQRELKNNPRLME
jgi:Kef-type K+ transport system membrane component KefB